jgi:hypothetical protein
MATNPPDISFDDDAPLYCEDQKDALCAKHAINHILQEEKIVWMAGNENLYINKTDGTTAREADLNNKDVAINLFEFCAVNDATAAVSVEGDPGERACKGNGNLAFDRIPSLIRLLGYDRFGLGDGTSDFLHSEGLDKTVFINRLYNNVKQKCVLGAILNLGGWHYTAIVKFAKGCAQFTPKGENGTIAKTNTYAYMDSYGPGGKFVGYCGTGDQLKTHLSSRNIVACLFITDHPNSYGSVAAVRRRKLYPFDRTPCPLPILPGGGAAASPAGAAASPVGAAASPAGAAASSPSPGGGAAAAIPKTPLPAKGGARKFKHKTSTRKANYRTRTSRRSSRR